MNSDTEIFCLVVLAALLATLPVSVWVLLPVLVLFSLDRL
jgi:hypothetical protein